MTILQRYLLRSFFPTFLMSVGLLLFVLLMNYFLRLFNLAVMKGIPMVWVFMCFARLLPFFLSLALPMAFLVALLLTLGQLSENGEVMALRASGFSFKDILAPFFAVAVVLTGLLSYINHKASPDGFHSFKNSYTAAVARISRLSLDAKTLTRIGEWEIYADTVAEDGALSGVRLVKRRGRYRSLRISAPAGRTRIRESEGVVLELDGGSLVWPNRRPDSHTISTFKRSSLFIPFVDYGAVARAPEIQELSTRRLYERLVDLGGGEQKTREFRTEAALRSAGAAAPFVLFWVACPLGIRLEKRSRAFGFALSLVVIFGFYGLLALGIGLGRKDLFWSRFGPWLPDAACLLAGAALWRRRLRG